MVTQKYPQQCHLKWLTTQHSDPISVAFFRGCLSYLSSISVRMSCFRFIFTSYEVGLVPRNYIGFVILMRFNYAMNPLGLILNTHQIVDRFKRVFASSFGTPLDSLWGYHCGEYLQILVFVFCVFSFS